MADFPAAAGRLTAEELAAPLFQSAIGNHQSPMPGWAYASEAREFQRSFGQPNQRPPNRSTRRCHERKKSVCSAVGR
jgi:hypothetical protein